MAAEEWIQAAQKVIGDSREDDFRTPPTKHPDVLPSEAAALAHILRKSEIAVVARRYEAKDREAVEAQNSFKSSANKANGAVFATACSGAMIVLVGPWVPDSWGKGVLILLGCAGIFAGALASMWLFKVHEGKLLEESMGVRAATEALRVKYFELVTSAQDPATSTAGAGIPLSILQTEYFRRYQLDLQRDFFKRRRKQHKDAANKLLGLSAFAVAAGSLATGLSGFLAGALSPQWVSIAGLGAIASATSAFASTREALNQHRRNQERYARTTDALEELTTMLDGVRESAAAGNGEPLKHFVAAVHEQLSLEHKEWLGAAESTQLSITKLEQALAEAKDKATQSDSSKTTPPPDQQKAHG
jgi:hypothetical protein